MIVVYAADTSALSQVVQLLGDLRPTVFTGHPPAHGAFLHARVAIIVAPVLPHSGATTLIHDLQLEVPAVYRLLVTRCAPGNMEDVVKLVGQAQVLFLEEVDRTLLPAVRGFLDASPLSWLLVQVRRHLDHSPVLCNAIVKSCGLGLPPRTVSGLCRMARIPEARFRYLWADAFDQRARPKELVEWLLLARSMELRDKYGSWASVARALGIREDTLQAQCQRRVGLPLDCARRAGRAALQNALQNWWTLATAADLRNSG